MVQTGLMRTSITLDEDTYEIATLYSKGRGITLSRAINEMVRKATAPQSSEPLPASLMRMPNGMIVARPQGRVITNEMVKAALEDEFE
jgi:hypothetical protein